jgi:hypothetical protein
VYVSAHGLVLGLIVADLALSALIVLGRGAARTVRTYTPCDAVIGVIEVGLMIWGVLWLAHT